MSIPPTDDPMSIFVNGNLKPGKYKVQNLKGQTFLEILEHSKGLCCRPDTVLRPEDAVVTSTHYWPSDRVPNVSQWEFQASGSGYNIKKVRMVTYIPRKQQACRMVWCYIGRTREARSILQCIRRAILRTRERGLGYGLPGGVESRSRE
jgi:hypothetical protein